MRDEVVCVVQRASQDPDRETPRLAFSWYRDGERLPIAPDRDRLPVGSARHGETLRCEAVASDGELSSSVARTETKVVNLPPGQPVTVERVP